MELFHLLMEAKTKEEYEALSDKLQKGGYSKFSELLEHFKNRLKVCDEASLEDVRKTINKARQIIPFPENFSPIWYRIWDEFESMLDHKQTALRNVPESERDGEWQIIMDNPYTNANIVCYPGLSFLEAAYLYGYFMASLAKNEYIRMQKVVNLLVSNGRSSH